MTPRPRRNLIVWAAATALAAPPAALAEVLDRTATVSATAEIARLTPTVFTEALDQRNAITGAVGDVDGDGDQDLLIAHRTVAEPPFALINDGQGGFAEEGPARVPALSPGETMSLVLVDLDGDGDLDAYLGRSPADAVWINDGLGRFQDATALWLPEGWGGSSDAATADLTLDGRPDVAVVQAGAVRVLENVRGLALRDISLDVAAPAEGITAIALADVDGDGDADLAGAGSANIQVWLNDRPQLRALTPMANPSSQRITGLTAAEVTGDGLPDVIVSRHDQPLILTSRGAGQFLLTFAPVRILANAAQAADLDGDGRRDVFFSAAGADALLFNGGTNIWLMKTGWLPLEAEAGRWVALADFNGDSLTDAYVANDGQDQLYLQRRAP